jgi:hypothetical protein
VNVAAAGEVTAEAAAEAGDFSNGDGLAGFALKKDPSILRMSGSCEIF